MNNILNLLFTATILVGLYGNMATEARILFEDPEMRSAFENRILSYERNDGVRNFLNNRLISLLTNFDNNPIESTVNCKYGDVACNNGVKHKKSNEKERKKMNMLTR